MLYFNTESRLKRNKIILAAKIILFHFRRGSTLKWNTEAFYFLHNFTSFHAWNKIFRTVDRWRRLWSEILWNNSIFNMEPWLNINLTLTVTLLTLLNATDPNHNSKRQKLAYIRRRAHADNASIRLHHCDVTSAAVKISVFSFGGPIHLSLHRRGFNLAWRRPSVYPPCQILPRRCNVSPLRGEKLKIGLQVI